MQKSKILGIIAGLALIGGSIWIRSAIKNQSRQDAKEEIQKSIDEEIKQDVAAKNASSGIQPLVSNDVRTSNGIGNAGWDEKQKEMFMKGCRSAASKKVSNPAVAEAYCDCMLQHVQQKFTDINDYSKNADSDTSTMCAQVLKNQ